MLLLALGQACAVDVIERRLLAYGEFLAFKEYIQQSSA